MSYIDPDQETFNLAYHNRLIVGFVSSTSGIIVYLKQCENTQEYAVKVKHKDGTRTIVTTSCSLSVALQSLADHVDQLTDSLSFTVWRSL